MVAKWLPLPFNTLRLVDSDVLYCAKYVSWLKILWVRVPIMFVQSNASLIIAYQIVAL